MLTSRLYQRPLRNDLSALFWFPSSSSLDFLRITPFPSLDFVSSPIFYTTFIMAAKNRELQMLQIPESIFVYEAPLEIERDQNAQLRTDEEL